MDKKYYLDELSSSIKEQFGIYEKKDRENYRPANYDYLLNDDELFERFKRGIKNSIDNNVTYDFLKYDIYFKVIIEKDVITLKACKKDKFGEFFFGYKGQTIKTLYKINKNIRATYQSNETGKKQNIVLAKDATIKNNESIDERLNKVEFSYNFFRLDLFKLFEDNEYTIGKNALAHKNNIIIPFDEEEEIGFKFPDELKGENDTFKLIYNSEKSSYYDYLELSENLSQVCMNVYKKLTLAHNILLDEKKKIYSRKVYK